MAMNMEEVVGAEFGASVQRGAGVKAGKKLENRWHVEAKGPDGVTKWVDEFDNIVVTDGLNDSLTKHLKGSSYTAAWYVGLTDGTPTVDPTDVMNSHAGWVEVEAYDEAVRQTLTLGTASAGSISNTASKAVFTISADSTTVGGAFVTSVSTKGGTTGVLYGAGAFTAGDKSLDDNDTLTVTVTLTAAAA
jgi:hypothetical protein